MAPAFVLGLVAALAFGVSIGSFLNVVIYRVPRGESVSSPTWSYCPNCHTRLIGWDLVPIFSFLFLGTKCRYCKKPISWRYLTVETITGVLFAGLFCTYGWHIETVAYCLFAAVLVAAFFIDLDYFIIPDELNVLGVGFGIALNIAHYWTGDPPARWTIGPVHILASIGSAVVCALLFHLISLVGYLYYTRRGAGGPVDVGADAEPAPSVFTKIGWFTVGILDDFGFLLAKFCGLGFVFPGIRRWIDAHEVIDEPEAASLPDQAVPSGTVKTREEIAQEIESDEEQTGMGQGDAKLAAAIGSVLLLKMALLSIFVAIVLGGIVSVVLLVTGRRGGRSAIPFGPYLVAGTLIVLFTGTHLLDWYLLYAFPAR
ncbi:MAG: prepilin peptidase [Capsulimonadaceae bacterium]|nr:prepilin peptidase [Capsulimonadaceae bacterium]